MLEILPKDLDTDGFLLNTPEATFDLRQGIQSKMESNYSHFITKQTSVSPDDVGMDKWLDALDVFFLAKIKLSLNMCKGLWGLLP